MFEDQRRAADMATWWLRVIEGYNAHLMGAVIAECPYEDLQEQIAWKHGWRPRAWAALEESVARTLGVRP